MSIEEIEEDYWWHMILVCAQVIRNESKLAWSIHLNSKGNEIIAWCLFDVWLCFFLSSNHHYMCYCCWCSLHHICANQISNDNVHQSTDVVSNNKNIHSSSGVVREKVGDLLLNMCFAFQSNNYNSIRKCHGLLYIHSHKGTEINGYINCQWYDYTNTMKGA